MFPNISSIVLGLVLTVSSWFGAAPLTPQSIVTGSAPIEAQSDSAAAPTAPFMSTSGTARVGEMAQVAPVSAVASNVAGPVLSESDLLAMAGDTYADGSVPLGDYKYVTTGPKKGYVYLCSVHKDNPGSMVNGPWMHSDTWNFLEKTAILGSISWPQATFSMIVSGASRVFSGNGLPVGYTTGVFPVASSDPASKYDPNPNTIKAQAIRDTLPLSPVYSDTPYCMGGEVGIMTNGVPLFNAFDAGLRDAPAHELQDSCDGHPQGSGEYHYHSLSSCFKDTNVETVLGFAYDGFPITGGEVAAGKYLTTADLDECHGITSEIMLDGKKTVSYHYVMTQDFPYSASCFRGKPVTTGPSAGSPSASGAQSGGTQGTQQGTSGHQPPQAAIDACSGKTSGASCSINTPQGSLSGQCNTPPNTSQLACIPR